MTPFALVQHLRSRGYSVRRDGDELVIRGPRPTDEQASLAWLREHKHEVLAVVDAEQHPSVQMALDVFEGAEIVDVKTGLTPTSKEGKTQ
jgi:hypothetical protein